MHPLLTVTVLVAANVAIDDSARTPAALSTPSDTRCENAEFRTADKMPATLRTRPLEQEPLGKQILGVVNLVDGCEKPIVVRENVGR